MTVVPEENCPPTLTVPVTLTQTLTLIGGNYPDTICLKLCKESKKRVNRKTSTGFKRLIGPCIYNLIFNSFTCRDSVLGLSHKTNDNIKNF